MGGAVVVVVAADNRFRCVVFLGGVAAGGSGDIPHKDEDGAHVEPVSGALEGSGAADNGVAHWWGGGGTLACVDDCMAPS